MIFAYHCICSVAILEQCNYTFTIFHPFQSISPIWAFHRPHESDSNEQCAQIRLCRFHSVSIWPSVEICWVCTASGNQSSTALRLCARLLSWSSDQNFALPRGHGKSPCFTRVIFSVQVWRSVALMFSLSIGWVVGTSLVDSWSSEFGAELVVLKNFEGFCGCLVLE